MVQLALLFLIVSALVPGLGAIQVPFLGVSLETVVGYSLIWLLLAAPINRILVSIFSPSGERIEFKTESSGPGRAAAAALRLLNRLLKFCGLDPLNLTAEDGKVSIQIDGKPVKAKKADDEKKA